MKHIPIGTDDFRTIRASDWLYVDKSLLIREVLHSGSVLLLPRPRRFGKTLNMTMLQTFFDDKQDSRPLFEGLAISSDPEAMSHLNAYPTIFLSFKKIIANSWVNCQKRILEVICEMMETHQPFVDLQQVSPAKRRLFEAAYDKQAQVSDLTSCLHLVTELLYRSTGKKAIILIDEYDTPIHDGYTNGYFPQIISFMRGFLGEALKGNPYLERAVITGILRVGKESIYSGLNNLTVSSILEERFSTHFGFTEEEVSQLLVELDSPHPLSEVQSWYNGYRFGSTTIYNPWSILKMLELGAEPLKAHWLGTSGNELIMDLVKQRQAISTEDIEVLLLGGSRTCEIQESVSMADLDAFSVWSLLLFSGYLTVSSWDPATMQAQLCLPNREVRMFFARNVARWLGFPGQVDQMKQNLLALRLNQFVENLAASIKNILSYHDVGGPRQEKTYHVFMVGLLASLHDRFEVLSNRESGYGRYDLALLPREPGLPGFIFEFKQALPESLAATAEAALGQIAERDYASTMRQRGVVQIASLGLAFHGKRVALACSIEDPNTEASDQVSHYSAGEADPPELGQKPTRRKSKQTAKLPSQANLVLRLQLLQQERGLPPAPFETLLSLDRAALEEMIQTLKPD